MNTYQSTSHANADNMLKGLSTLKAKISVLTGVVEKEIEDIAKNARRELEPLEDQYNRLEKKLKTWMKKEKSTLFPEKIDLVDLPKGVLLHSVQKRVKRARGVLDALERIGLGSYIKTNKSPDWDKLDADMNDSELAVIGTKRVEKDNYEYELKEKAGAQ